MKNKINKSTEMLPSRLEALSDGIFAFAMTLLVLSINLPEVSQDINIGSFLVNQLPNFWNFALSFLLLAIIWIYLNQQLHHIKRTSFGFILINILLLLFVALIPFSTSFISDFPDVVAAELFFNLNMLMLACLLSLNWWYALKNKFVDTMGDEKHIALVSRKQYIFPAVSLLAVILTFIIPGYSSMSYILIPILIYLPTKK